MKKFVLNLGTGLLVTSLLGVALAAGSDKKMDSKMTPKMAPKTGAKMAPKTGAKMTQMTATISKMKGDKLMVMPTAAGKKAVMNTVTVPSSAKIMMGSKTMKMSDLKAGEKVTFMMKDGTVTKVMVANADKMAPKTGAKMAPKTAPKMAPTSGKMMPKKP